MSMNYTVGFLMQSPFHYFLYESIINELVNRKVECHLLINDDIMTDNEWVEMYDNLVGFVETIDRGDIEAFTVTTVKLMGFQYDCVVSPYYIEELKGLGDKNVRLMYSLAKENFTFSWWNALYDKILCYGEYDFRKLNIYNNCTVIGNPKFDKWFKDQEKFKFGKIINLYNLNIHKDKETILYAPTYGELSSIDEWIETICDLKENYNIIIKLHHGTSHLKSEQQRKQKIYNLFVNVLEDSADLLDLLKISDYVISDYSGLIFDAILADKTILLLNTQHLRDSKLTDDKSIEVKIRKEILNIDKGTKIKDVLAEKKKLHQQQIKLKKIVNTFYSKQDGNAGQRGAEEIIKVIKEKEDSDNKL